MNLLTTTCGVPAGWGADHQPTNQNPFLALKWSDYGLFENRQDRKMQFFMANRFPLLPGQNSANLGGKRANNQIKKKKNVSRDLVLGRGIYF